MKVLEKEFVRSGFIHRQVFRSGMIAIYERYKPGQSVKHWEVIRIREVEDRKVFDKDVPAHEVYPSDEAWGTLGFTTNEFERAKVMAEGLLIGAQKRERDGYADRESSSEASM